MDANTRSHVEQRKKDARRAPKAAPNLLRMANYSDWMQTFSTPVALPHSSTGPFFGGNNTQLIARVPLVLKAALRPSAIMHHHPRADSHGLGNFQVLANLAGQEGVDF